MVVNFRFTDVLVGSTEHGRLMPKLWEAVGQGLEVNYEEQPVGKMRTHKAHSGLKFHEQIVLASGYIRS